MLVARLLHARPPLAARKFTRRLKEETGNSWITHTPPRGRNWKQLNPAQPLLLFLSSPMVTFKDTQKATWQSIFIFFLHESFFFFFQTCLSPRQICFSILVWLFFPSLNDRSDGCGVGCRRWSLY